MNIPTRQLPLGAGHGAPLPYDAFVEYVESDGSSWVETDYVPTAGAFAIDMTALTPVAGFMMYFGAMVSLQNRIYATNVSGGTTAIAWQLGTAKPSNTVFPSVSRSRTSYTFAGNTHPFFVFYISNNSYSNFHPANARFRSAQFWDAGGDLELDLVSVRVGTAGALYDRVSGTLYYSATSTALIPGPDLP